MYPVINLSVSPSYGRTEKTLIRVETADPTLALPFIIVR